MFTEDVALFDYHFFRAVVTEEGKYFTFIFTFLLYFT